MTPTTDPSPGEVPRSGGRRAMLALTFLIALAWLYYLFNPGRSWPRLDAALASVPSGFATVLKTLTLVAAFLLPMLFVFAVLVRIGTEMDAPKASPEQMLEAVRNGHQIAIAKWRETIETQLATLSDADAAELRPLLEEGLRKSIESAAERERRFAANPELMLQEVRNVVAEARAGQRAG